MMANIPFNDKNCYLECIDGAKGLESLPPKSVKLIYGSPPYPNAVRNYGVWKENEYIDRIAPFIDASVKALRDDGFLVINVKANRTPKEKNKSSKRSLIVERLTILLEDRWSLSCVDIELWVKGNPAPTGLKVACQDAYEQILWFSKAPKWEINLDDIRRPYAQHSLNLYETYEYKSRENGLSYVRKNKSISANPLGALPQNVIFCGVEKNKSRHQAVQPIALPKKYIKACTSAGDIVVDPWLGSGTTGVAALQLGRKFVGFELQEEYVSMASQRIEKNVEGQ